jgi:hypothetical protein
LAFAFLITVFCAIGASSSAYGTDDTPAGAGLHLRVTPLTRGLVPNGRFVVRFSVNYSGPGRSGDIFLSFVAADGHAKQLTPKVVAKGLRLKKRDAYGTTSMLVAGVSSGRTRMVRATYSLRADGKICVRRSQAWVVNNPSEFKANAKPFCNYTIQRP